MKKFLVVLLAVAMVFAFAACGDNSNDEPVTSGGEEQHDPVTIMVAAAESLENTYVDQIIPAFTAKYDWITV